MRRPEQQIQRAVFAHLRARAVPGVFAFHPANGGYRKPVEAAIMKGLGVVAGVPDVIAIHQGKTYALELKALGGRATPKQAEVMDAMRMAGAHCGVAVGLDETLAILESWGLLKPNRMGLAAMQTEPAGRKKLEKLAQASRPPMSESNKPGNAVPIATRACRLRKPQEG